MRTDKETVWRVRLTFLVSVLTPAPWLAESLPVIRVPIRESVCLSEYTELDASLQLRPTSVKEHASEFGI
jgi:hypothetical protein